MPEESSVSATGRSPVDSEFRIVLVGEPSVPEFEIVAEVLLTAAPEATYQVVADPDQLVVDLRDEDAPDLIVFVQTWSDEYHFSEVVTLPSIGPLTQLLCVYGPWCAADGRSRLDWPLALRIPLENFRVEIVQAIILASDSCLDVRGLRSDSPIPWTAGRDEVFTARYAFSVPDTAHKSPSRSLPARICVVTPDLGLRQLWSDLLNCNGYQIDVSGDPCDIIIWDADPSSSSCANSELIKTWEGLGARAENSKLIVLTGFHTPDQVERWKSLGAVAVVSKLLPLQHFLSEIDGFLV
ncbi:MAG: hypothetical protein JWM11_5372 [Planctomycetaceae bacterium]|nr:hypothetical protein [Planctomycetaceae bacterium]